MGEWQMAYFMDGPWKEEHARIEANVHVITGKLDDSDDTVTYHRIGASTFFSIFER